MKRVPREHIPAILNNTQGQFFGIHFVKLNGDVRKINGHMQGPKERTKAKNRMLNLLDKDAPNLPKKVREKIAALHAKEARSYEPDDYGYIKVWDRNAKEYRSVNYGTMFELTLGKKRYEIV